MEAWKKAEMSDAKDAVSTSHYIDVWGAKHDWTSPDGKRKGWKVVIEHTLSGKPELEKVTTYDESLTTPGRHSVYFYRNSQYMRCISKTRKN